MGYILCGFRCLNTWSLVGGAIWRGYWTFSGWRGACWWKYVTSSTLWELRASPYLQFIICFLWLKAQFLSFQIWLLADIPFPPLQTLTLWNCKQKFSFLHQFLLSLCFTMQQKKIANTLNVEEMLKTGFQISSYSFCSIILISFKKRSMWSKDLTH